MADMSAFLCCMVGGLATSLSLGRAPSPVAITHWIVFCVGFNRQQHVDDQELASL